MIEQQWKSMRSQMDRNRLENLALRQIIHNITLNFDQNLSINYEIGCREWKMKMNNGKDDDDDDRKVQVKCKMRE